MKYTVALKKSKEGYSVSCPGLPGCWSQGKTEQEALENIQYAIREYFEAVALISRGSKIREVEVLV
jgi:predicted RNase H-like HicB family nuclease